MRDERNEDVRMRVEATVGRPLRQAGRDYILPDGRRVVICYSKFHPTSGDFYLGLPNRLEADDILVLLLEDRHLVFPRAETLLRYKEFYPRSSNGRPIPSLKIRDGEFILRIAKRDLTISLDDRIDAYNELVSTPGPAEAGSAKLGSEANSAAIPDLDTDDPGTGEGAVALRAHLRRERDPKLRRRKLTDTKRRRLPIACEVCAFDFGHVYGARGLDFIECHHRTPLHVTGETQTRLADLVLVCSNCHRMIHRTAQWLTVQELRNLVDAQRRLVSDGSASSRGG